MERQQRPSQSNAFKPLPEDDLAHFEALVDRMMRHRAEAGLPSRGAQEPLIDAPKITISHPAEFRAERRFEQPATVVAPPWHVRHARKLIGTGVLVVGAGTAYLAYTNAWRFAPEQQTSAAPAAPEPGGPVERPITPAPPPVAQPPASATVRSAAVPATAPTAASAVSRPPAVTHTVRETASVPATAAAPAVVAAPQPAVAPSDCPESIAALGLCAARITKAAK